MNNTIFPVLPLRDIVVFPHMVVPLFVGREKSVLALESLSQDDDEILLITQRDATTDDPDGDDLYDIGTVANIMQLLKLPDGTLKVLMEGTRRVKIARYIEGQEYLQAEVEEVVETIANDEELDVLCRTVVEQFEDYAKLDKKIPPDIIASVQQIDDASKLADTIAQNLLIKVPEKQTLLENSVVDERLENIFGHMQGEIDILNVEKKIRNRVKRQMEKTQREYYLNEQMKAIQKELGDGGDGKNEFDEIQDRIKNTKLSDEAREKAEAELKKLRSMSPMSSESSVIRNYLDWMLDVPWQKPTRLKRDLKWADKILEEDHYGLETVKERILEHLAVLSRSKKLKGPILCLVGPPGVGKTSLGRSIARATNRNFVRISLGGVRDEAEIRGHRRTYIGSMPGRFIQGMKKAGSSNPLFLLDEIDKLGGDWRGDPSSALLEVLDPEQNNCFNDHYLEVDYDLSDVMFVATANSMNIAAPLLDRMEVIRIAGYTEDEKLEIAKNYLIPKQVKDHGLRKNEWSISDDAVRDVVRYYTREAGVRGLERQIAKLNRKAVHKILLKKTKKIDISPDNLHEDAGVRQYNFGVAEDKDSVGIVTGLAWTSVGGDILTIESVLIPGKGVISKTGKLGDVMKESISAAENLIKSRAGEFGIQKDVLNKNNVHIHVPEGAVPKEGPSAGIAMVTSIVSTLTGIPVRRDVAMTGEITLRGRVLPIGGLKEKLLAAKRGGIKTALIPKENEKNLVDVPDNIKENLEIIPVDDIRVVLEHALTKPIIPVIWPEDDKEQDKERKTASDEIIKDIDDDDGQVESTH